MIRILAQALNRILSYFSNNLIPGSVAKLIFILCGVAVSLHPGVISITTLTLFAIIHRFYRDPERVCPTEEGVIYSPSDGIVKSVTNTEVLIYLNLLDVHIQRFPANGQIISQSHKPGQYLFAWHPKSAGYNEQLSTMIESAHGHIEVTQIAGKFTRRIQAWKKLGAYGSAGEKFGIIHFSSACKINLPSNHKITIKEGERVYAGISPIATHSSNSKWLNFA